jgi:hypothetical protein
MINGKAKRSRGRKEINCHFILPQNLAYTARMSSGVFSVKASACLPKLYVYIQFCTI